MGAGKLSTPGANMIPQWVAVFTAKPEFCPQKPCKGERRGPASQLSSDLPVCYDTRMPITHIAHTVINKYFLRLIIARGRDRWIDSVQRMSKAKSLFCRMPSRWIGYTSAETGLQDTHAKREPCCKLVRVGCLSEMPCPGVDADCGESVVRVVCQRRPALVRMLIVGESVWAQGRLGTLCFLFLCASEFAIKLSGTW